MRCLSFKRRDGAECHIITTAPSALCAPIHNRMPVIIDPADYPAWVGETSAAPEQLQALLRPIPAERKRRSGGSHRLLQLGPSRMSSPSSCVY
jgi:putative SOS response-associated peptidase YedK